MLNFEDILSDNMIKIEVSHNEKMPDFFSWQGVAAVTAFSVIMFVVNLLVMNKQAPTQYEHLVARYGGEEFCIVLACDSPIEIEPYVSSLVTSVQQLNIENSQSPTAECVTISVGATSGQIARYHQLSTLIQVADRALYQVKDTGRNNYKIAPKHELSPV
ncbi:diguanylate cyclase [Vibrio brasiliensis]